MAFYVVCKEKCIPGDVQCVEVKYDKIANQLCMKKNMEIKKKRSDKKWKCTDCRSQSVSSINFGVYVSNNITMDCLGNIMGGYKLSF